MSSEQAQDTAEVLGFSNDPDYRIGQLRAHAANLRRDNPGRPWLGDQIDAAADLINELRGRLDVAANKLRWLPSQYTVANENALRVVGLLHEDIWRIADDLVASGAVREGRDGDTSMSDRIALRPDHENPELLDDVVIRDVEMVHAEMMEKRSMHVAVYFPGTDERLTLWVRATNRRGQGLRLEVTATEQPQGDEFTYEDQP